MVESSFIEKSAASTTTNTKEWKVPLKSSWFFFFLSCREDAEKRENSKRAVKTPQGADGLQTK